MISAVIFDFDGVIVDSERLHWAAFNEVMNPLGKTISWPEYIETYIGFDDRDAFRHAFPELENSPRPSLHSGHSSAGGESNQSPPAEGCPTVSTDVSAEADEAKVKASAKAEAFGEGWKGGVGSSLDQLIVKKAAAFQELLAVGGAAALPGAVELIQHLSGQIPIAICSGALREDILPIIRKLGVADAFDTIVTADDTHISKPDPAPYQLAKDRLGASTALAIEDTPAGIASAKGAGLKVLAVTNSYERNALTQADATVDSLEGLSLDQLNSLAG